MGCLARLLFAYTRVRQMVLITRKILHRKKKLEWNLFNFKITLMALKNSSKTTQRYKKNQLLNALYLNFIIFN